MTDAPELKPCPFCGGEAHAHETQQDSEYCAQVQCKNCGVEVVFWLPWTASGGDRVKALLDCERRWNTRAPDPDLEAHIGAALAEAAKLFQDRGDKGLGAPYRAPDRILSLHPDALQALDRVRREALVDGMRRSLDIVAAHGWAQQIYEELFDAIEAEERTDSGEGE